MSAIVCRNCGQRNRTDAHVCIRCSTPLAGKRRGAAGTAGTGARRSFALMPTLGIAACLSLVGIGGVKAAGLLTHAMSPAQPGDLAAITCTALETQDYSLLTNALDPSTVKPNTPGTYTPAVLTAQLRALDATAGTVTKCTYQQISAVPASNSHGAIANFAVNVQRAHQKASTGLVLVLDQARDGSWKISAASNLTGNG